MASGSASGRRRMTVNDIYTLKMASDARISPDGSQIVYVETWLDRHKNDYRSALVLVSPDSGDTRRLTWTDARETHPRWWPDGEGGEGIAFISSREEKQQVFFLPLSGGEARRLTDFDEGVDAFAWSPDGTRLALVTKSTDQPAEAGEDPNPSDVMRITSIRYKANGVPGILDGKRSHIWIVSVPEGNATQLTRGDFDDVSPAWTPDGAEVLFVSDRSEDRDFDRARQTWAVPARGGEPRLVLGSENDMFTHPSASPDGGSVAVRGHRNAVASSSTNQQVWTAPVGGGEPGSLTASLDRSTEDAATADFYGKSSPGLVWDRDGSSVYFQVSDRGSVHIYRAGTGKPPELVVGGDRRVLDFTVSPKARKIAFTASDPLNPADIFVCDLDGGNERRLTAVNQQLLDEIDLSAPEEYTIASQNPDGWDVHGWVMKPPHFQSGEKYPTILTIHGGPHGMYGNAFFHEFQVLAAQGYVVVYANPRASQGYGQAFLDSTLGCWGEADMPDLMAALDHVVAQGYVDTGRLGVTGGSYGGFMTNWIIAHSDRFRAAITDRCVSNLTSMYGTSDIGFTFGEHEWGGTPWEEREKYVKFSPITYVEKMTAPLLIVHSEQDHRCPIEQGEQLYVALKKLGRTVEFVRFPDENHELSRNGQPHHRTARLEANLDWWERWL